MRKTLKILHTLASCGLIGGLACYMIMLVMAPQETPAAYADLRQSIADISNYVLLPSLAIALVSGLFSMAVHRPFQNKRWAWIKAAMGLLMFKGVLAIIGANADHAATLSRRIANGEPAGELLDVALANEWLTLGVIMALSVANVLLGVWRPRLQRRPPRLARRAPEVVPEADSAPAESERTRPAA